MITIDGRRYLTMADAAQQAGVTVQHISHLCITGRLARIRVGVWLVDAEGFEGWLRVRGAQ